MKPEENFKEFWKKVLAEVQLEVTPVVFGTIISRTHLEQLDDNSALVLCADEFIRKNMEKKYFAIVQEALNRIAKKDIKLVLGVKPISTTTDKKIGQDAKDLGPLFQPKDPNELLNEKINKSGLTSKYTFENYITGKNNQLATAIAKAVAEKPGEIYNPVFIYSGVGLGKTHLMQAIGNFILKNKPGMKVIYTTGESFTNEMIDAIQSGKGKGRYASNDFRNKYRKADVFLIDDIQFIAGKDATQEEFFHTFNALYLSQKQIVITSDKPPKDFTNLEERISSRFNSGIIVDMQTPDFETRIAILRARRDKDIDPINNEVINVIAENVTSNVRELEGAYLRILSYAKATGEEITPEIAMVTLGQTIKEKNKKPVNMNEILNAVCSYYSIKSSDIKGKKRTKELVLPRQVVMYLIKDLTNTPYISIGDFLGGRDHTTVMYGVDKIGQDLKDKQTIKQDIVNVKQMLFSV
ncbi:chromosomal replication initiator protein DnaA [candidate division WWE3 bacterium]|uniref:Chromosomal replication initiator protein DnaA n=1 Tax=candidate division WWE3 bacterium TaxID=2053526 RepID=A0A7X9DLM5_UNCKA|nr:chromosomal replication initiator protein DnaA [candidate division WWE3 bacterium]